MTRCFISINMPENVRREIEKIQDKLPEFKGKKTEQENLHLTLKFLGEIEEYKIERVKKKLREIGYNPFETEIDSIGFFDNRASKVYSRNLVVWLHMTNCDGLQKKIDEALFQLFEPERRFMSHLTIARVKYIRDKRKFLDELKKIEIPKIRFKTNNFYLMKSELTSEGPRYSVLEEYNLN